MMTNHIGFWRGFYGIWMGGFGDNPKCDHGSKAWESHPPLKNPTKIKMRSKSQPGYSLAIKWGCLASGFQHLTMFLYKPSITQFKGRYTTWGDYRIIVDSCLQKPKVRLWPVAGVTSEYIPDFLGVESPISLTFSAPQKAPKDPNMYPKLERSKNLFRYRRTLYITYKYIYLYYIYMYIHVYNINSMYTYIYDFILYRKIKSRPSRTAPVAQRSVLPEISLQRR